MSHSSRKKKKGHDKRKAAYQKPNTVLICIFQKRPSEKAELPDAELDFSQGG